MTSETTDEYMRRKLALLDDSEFGDQISEAEKHSCQPSGIKSELGLRQFTARPARFHRTAYSRSQLMDGLASTNDQPTMSFLRRHDGIDVAALQDGYEYTYEQDIDDRKEFCVYWQIRRSGLIYQKEIMREDINNGKMTQSLFVNESLRYIAESTDNVGRFYSGLDPVGVNVVVRVRFRGTAGRTLIGEAGMRMKAVACPLSEVCSEVTVDASLLRDNPDECTLELLADILEQCGWIRPQPADVEKRVADAHEGLERRFGSRTP